MDIEKMRKWLEITNEYKKTDFWSSVLKEKHPDEFLREEKGYPKVDIYQDEQNNFVIIEIPGMEREHILLHLISNTRLKISGKMNPIFPQEMEIQRERTCGEFERVIELPEAARAQELRLQNYNGLLYISYPRNVERII
ncbi:Hsp20/alpha crystallin family protein [Bacillus benzoevorans]|uniref:HSP20 family protein n=1 Tax=Bacillus benzoevorans TaxID=1456 RepID=A0A7X0HTV7_9BACI|nr:Hsp20/alpha crystallin family protein [Bacillus benzoevorans]MBB6446779.1 HSP20 family protein [Bacillus benzoevorans]